ncbi:MAG: hypothetical protein OEZ01_15255 [Candidatus Heimdallarchaeota archaeon]|nr:hypothetical protein [Candidatus Heimdallarchaeota archaeon]MDH5647366.1 hypothetical protein [Candidatus Heimdallarchaeota archaeon]
MGFDTEDEDKVKLSLDSIQLDDDNEYLAIGEILTDLIHFPYKNKDQLGQPIERYNGAVSVDVLKEKATRIVRSPIKFMDIIKFFKQTKGVDPSYGLKYDNGDRRSQYIHLLLEYNDGNSDGVIFLDTHKMLSFKQVYKIEKIRDYMNLNTVHIIANQIGLPAKDACRRINSERGNILTLRHFDTIKNKSLNDYW